MFVRAFRAVAPFATLLATAAQAQPSGTATVAATSTTATATIAIHTSTAAIDTTDQIIAAPEEPFEYAVPLEDVATAEEGSNEAVVVTGSRTEKRLSEAPVATEVITR